MRGTTTTTRGPVPRPRTQSSRPPSGQRDSQKRWTSCRGPVTGITGTPTIANPYQYADNNPLANADPTGRFVMEDADFDLANSQSSCPTPKVLLVAFGHDNCGSNYRSNEASPYHNQVIKRRSRPRQEDWKGRPAIGYRLEFNSKDPWRAVAEKTGVVIHYTNPAGRDLTLTPPAKSTWYWHGSIDVMPASLIEFFGYTKYHDVPGHLGSQGILACIAR